MTVSKCIYKYFMNCYMHIIGAKYQIIRCKITTFVFKLSTNDN